MSKKLDIDWSSLKKYKRKIRGKKKKVDVYDVLKAFDVTCPATAHA